MKNKFLRRLVEHLINCKPLTGGMYFGLSQFTTNISSFTIYKLGRRMFTPVESLESDIEFNSEEIEIKQYGQLQYLNGNLNG
jgi:hypothetical protein